MRLGASLHDSGRLECLSRLLGITRLPRTIELPSAITCRAEATLRERHRRRSGEFIPLARESRS